MPVRSARNAGDYTFFPRGLLDASGNEYPTSLQFKIAGAAEPVLKKVSSEGEPKANTKLDLTLTGEHFEQIKEVIAEVDGTKVEGGAFKKDPESDSRGTLSITFPKTGMVAWKLLTKEGQTKEQKDLVFEIK